MKPSSFKYILEAKDILEYKKFSTDQKLQWLEEINAFNRTLPRKVQRMHKLFLGKSDRLPE